MEALLSTSIAMRQFGLTTVFSVGSKVKEFGKTGESPQSVEWLSQGPLPPNETGRTLYHNPGAHHRWSTDLLDAGREFGVSHENGQGLQMDWLT
jgi:hypothetical protein